MAHTQPLRVALINFHFAQNYGAVLQALALQDRLRDIGCEVAIIDYRPRGHWQQYARIPNPLLSAWWKMRGAVAVGDGYVPATRQAARRAVRALSSWRNARARGARLQSFEEFMKGSFSLTRRYNSLRQLRASPPVADIYVTGSDQVWNPGNTGGLDPAYYLAFGGDTIVRAGYAVSPCRLDVRRHHSRLARFAGAFDHLSLRESALVSDLSAVMRVKIDVVPDPVLLSTPAQLERYAAPIQRRSNPYILLYAVKAGPTYATLVRLIEQLRASTGAEVVDISLDESDWPFEVTRPENLTPGSFISYIRDAQYVASNSFHATAFSLLFGRDFTVVTEPGTSDRITELLEFAGLSGRIASPESADMLTAPIDYSTVSPRLAELRTIGEGFLTDVVEDGRRRHSSAAPV